MASIMNIYVQNQTERYKMKKILLLTAMLFGLFLSNLNAKSTFYNRNIDVDYFFGALEPYGEWLEIGYDEYVWRPNYVNRNWRPYSDGRWEWTHNGWYWVSYESFGWATYHYGRWFNDDYYGWVWMPDNEWAPSWVEWRYDDYYIGWAPLPPYARFNQGYGIHFSITWHSDYLYWNFVKYNHFNSRNVYKYYADRKIVRNVFNNTKYRTNYYSENDRMVNGGVDRRFIETKTRKKIVTRDINFSDRKQDSKDIRQRNEIREFRPTETDSRTATKVDRAKITKGRELNSLKKEDVVIKRNRIDQNTTERKVERREESPIVKDDKMEVTKKSNLRIDDNTKNESSKVEKRVESKREITKEVRANDLRKENSNKDISNNSTKVERSVEVKREVTKTSQPEKSIKSEKKETSRSRN